MTRCRDGFFSRRADTGPRKTGQGGTPHAFVAANRRDNPETLFATPAIAAERRADGSILLKSTTPLQPFARCVGDWLEHWARQTPERIFLGERSSVDAPWTTVTYKDALRQVRGAGAWILCAGHERRATAGDSVRQQHRARAVRAWGDACRRARGVDLAGLFADVEGFRQAEKHDHAARSRRDLCVESEGIRAGAGGDQAAACCCDREWRYRQRGCDFVSRDRRYCRKPMRSRKPSRPSARTPSQNSCSPRARPARRRRSSTPSAC